MQSWGGCVFEKSLVVISRQFTTKLHIPEMKQLYQLTFSSDRFVHVLYHRDTHISGLYPESIVSSSVLAVTAVYVDWSCMLLVCRLKEKSLSFSKLNMSVCKR